MQACKWYKQPYRNCTTNMQVAIYCWGIYIAGVYITDCCAGYIITYMVIILGNMQAAALQRQLVLKSYNWPWWSTCRSQCTVSNSPDQLDSMLAECSLLCCKQVAYVAGCICDW